MIYAIHRETKTHIVYRQDGSQPEVVGSVDWEFVEADADGWITWKGGECPLPDGARFEARRRDGEIAVHVNSWLHRWGHRDIIAYRPILDASEPEAPEWDGEGPARIGDHVYCISAPEHEAFEIIHWHDKIAWLRGAETGRHALYPLDELRPLRTPAEEEAVEEMLEITTAMHISDMKEAMQALYRAGYRKGAR